MPKKTKAAWTSNAETALNIIGDASKMAGGIPYLEAFAGILGNIVKMKQVRAYDILERLT
jgi:hypothetical protein